MFDDSYEHLSSDYDYEAEGNVFTTETGGQHHNDLDPHQTEREDTERIIIEQYSYHESTNVSRPEKAKVY